MRPVVTIALAVAFCAVESGCDRGARVKRFSRKAADRSAVVSHAAAAPAEDAASYSGTDSRGIPRYMTRRLTSEEQTILRRAFGVVSPSHLYISDSTEDGLLKYDPELKRCSSCYVNSFRLGFISVRRREESWDALERRVRGMQRGAFPPGSLVSSTALDMLDPDIQPEVREMLAAARRQGFRLRVGSTYRSPQQEAILMAEGHGLTHTLTSLHSYGRAIDISIGDGNINHPQTRAAWIAFRRWVIRYRGQDFRILGSPERTWDWPHVEVPSDRIGFRNLDKALEAGRTCLAAGSWDPCEFKPHLPATN